MQKIIGIDLGFGFCKVCSDNGRHMFPSIAGPCNEEVLRISGVRNPAYEHETVFLDNKKFLIGNSAGRYSERVYQARDKDWIDSFTYRCLLHHALRLAGVNNSSLPPPRDGYCNRTSRHPLPLLQAKAHGPRKEHDPP